MRCSHALIDCSLWADLSLHHDKIWIGHAYYTHDPFCINDIAFGCTTTFQCNTNLLSMLGIFVYGLSLVYNWTLIHDGYYKYDSGFWYNVTFRCSNTFLLQIQWKPLIGPCCMIDLECNNTLQCTDVIRRRICFISIHVSLLQHRFSPANWMKVIDWPWLYDRPWMQWWASMYHPYYADDAFCITISLFIAASLFSC